MVQQEIESQENNDVSMGSDDQSQDNTQQQYDLSGIFGEYAKEPSIQKFKSPVDLAKSYIELEKLIGNKRIPVPRNDEEVFETLKQLGMPEKPDEYKLENEEELQQVLGDLTPLKETAAKLGLLPQQYEKFVETYVQTLQQQQEVIQQQIQEMQQQAVQQLQKEWGINFDTNMQKAQTVYEKLPEDLQGMIDNSGLGNHPEFIKLMAALADSVFEGSNKANVMMTVSDAKEELSRIINDPNSPYYDKYHPEHKATVEKVNKLYEIIHGSE